jgi:hypothetical protein
MNASDIVADRLIERGLYLERYKAGLSLKMLAELEKLEDELTRELASAFSRKIPNTSLRIKRLEKLLADTRHVIRRVYSETNELSGKELLRLARNEQSYVVSAITEATIIGFGSSSLNYDQLRSLVNGSLVEGAKSADWWKRQGEDLTRRFSDQMRMGVMRDETLDQLVARVRGTQAKLYTDGVLQATRRQAEALVRSSVQVVANETRSAFYAANPRIVSALQWRATLDSRTTLICLALDGKRWTNDAAKKPIGHNKAFPGVTAHWACRSIQVPVIAKWEDLVAGQDRAKLDEEFRRQLRQQGFSDAEIADIRRNTRASLDGQVSNEQTLEEWLQGKSAGFQDELLGRGRGKLFRDQKITLTDLVDQRGRPLTIDQLEELTERRRRPRS